MRKSVVTGSASGVGRAVLQACQARGDIAIGVDLADAEIAADLSTAAGRKLAIESLSDWAQGAVDAVFACAGVSAGPADVMIGVNFFGVVDFVKGCHALLAAGKQPRVVAVSSQALMLSCDDALVRACLADDEEQARACALRLQRPELVYPSSKKALSLWIKRTAVTADWAGRGVLLNAVAPGVVETPMTSEFLRTREGREMLNTTTPMRLGRPAQPAELAALIAFMGSEANSFMLGQTVFCDGGADATLRPEQV